MTDSSEHTTYVQVAEDYKPRTVHMIMYDVDPIHPDAPVMIKSNTKGVFHVAKTSQVMRLIRDGMLERAKAPSEVEPQPEPEPEPEPEPDEASEADAAPDEEGETDEDAEPASEDEPATTNRRRRGRSRNK